MKFIANKISFTGRLLYDFDKDKTEITIIENLDGKARMAQGNVLGTYIIAPIRLQDLKSKMSDFKLNQGNKNNKGFLVAVLIDLMQRKVFHDLAVADKLIIIEAIIEYYK
jgi:hypothetical protein